MTTPSPANSFRETFCAQYCVSVPRYQTTVLRLTLYPHAAWLTQLSHTGILALDRAFVANVGNLTRWRAFETEVNGFECAAANRRPYRRWLRLRISIKRMRELFSEVMGASAISIGLRQKAWNTPESLAGD